MRRAFTILELLGATALTALLMVAVLLVVGSLGQSRAALARQPDAGAWRFDLVDTLRRDLTNAAGCDFRQNGMTLVCHGSLDRATLAHGNEPVTVVYGLAVIHGRRWLVRTQSSRAGLSNEAPWSELLCPDVSAFTVQPSGPIPVAAVDPAQDATPDKTVPPAVSVSIDGPTGRVVNETLVLR